MKLAGWCLIGCLTCGVTVAAEPPPAWTTAGDETGAAPASPAGGGGRSAYDGPTAPAQIAPAQVEAPRARHRAPRSEERQKQNGRSAAAGGSAPPAEHKDTSVLERARDWSWLGLLGLLGLAGLLRRRERVETVVRETPERT